MGWGIDSEEEWGPGPLDSDVGGARPCPGYSWRGVWDRGGSESGTVRLDSWGLVGWLWLQWRNVVRIGMNVMECFAS